MTAEPASAVAAVERLRDALEGLAAALATPSLEGVLESEAALEAALLALPPVRAAGDGETAAMRAAIERARRAVLRCRRLGASLGDVVRIGLEAQGLQGGYGPRASLPAYAGGTLNARG